MRILMMIPVLTLGCEDKDAGGGGDEVGVAALGAGSHDIDSVTFTEIGDDDDGLNVPRDLAFNPDVEGELWVVNRADDSVSIFQDVGTDDQSSENIVDPYALHFIEEVSSIAFGAVTFSGSDYRTFGTCHESENTYNDNYPGNGFMGPSLWSADPAIFGESNPAAVDYLTALFGFYADLGSHIDMLHESPLCMGIAWDNENVYWVFDGSDGNIVRYDFADDHDVGYDDHSDGIVSRYVEVEVDRVEDVPSHLILDHDSGLLYIADTGNNRILVLDTNSGEEGDRLAASEPGVDHHEMVKASFWTLLEGSDHGMGEPSGIDLIDGHLLVTDHANGNILAFDLDGELVDWIATGLDGIMGIQARSLDDIWFVDAEEDRLYRLQP